MKTTASVLTSPPSFSAPAAACPRAAPPWRILALLAALVLLAHALALGAAPVHFGPVPAPAPKTVPVMLTRSLSLPPPAPAKPTPAPAVAATPPAQAAPNQFPAKPLDAAQQAPAPAPQGPQTPETPTASDGPPQSSADQFSGLEQGSSPEEAPAPSPQVPPRTPPASSAAAATPPAAPPAKPGQHPVSAITLPASAEMGYEVTGNIKGLTYHAKGELLWRHNASSYQIQMTVRTLLFGSRGMSSQGQLGPEGLAPARFEDRARSEVAAHFEPGKGQISFSANTPSVPWIKGGQDRASVLIQLGAMLAGNPAAFPAGSSISVYTVGPRDADTWTFRVEGGEILSLPFGQLATIKLSRQLRHEHDKKLEVWYAPSLGYLPVRNKISEDNGDFVDQQLSTLGRH